MRSSPHYTPPCLGIVHDLISVCLTTPESVVTSRWFAKQSKRRSPTLINPSASPQRGARKMYAANFLWLVVSDFTESKNVQCHAHAFLNPFPAYNLVARIARPNDLASHAVASGQTTARVRIAGVSHHCYKNMPYFALQANTTGISWELVG